MKTVSDLVFACHSAACAPPPVGTGGSSGGASRAARAEWRSALRGAETVFERGGKSFVTSHKRSDSGKSTAWHVYQGVTGKPGTMRKVGGQRQARNSEKALEKMLKIVLDGAQR